MSEKGPKIRTVGSASEKGKEDVRARLNAALFNNSDTLPDFHKKEFQESEHEKFPLEVEMIHLANEETSQLMREAGLEPYDVPIENIRIVPPEVYEKMVGSKSSGITYRVDEVIIINSEAVNNPIDFYSIVAHELLHLKAHLAVEVQEEGHDHAHHTVFRNGVTTLPAQATLEKGKFAQHFAGLHEAIVAVAERSLVDKLLVLPGFKEDKAWLFTEEGTKARKKIAQDKNIEEADVLWVDPKDHTKFVRVVYEQQRKVFNYVCEEISRQFSDEFNSAEAVYKVFLNANFTGQLLPIARLVEKTFGEGSFRLLGAMDTDKESAILALETLQQARLRQT